MAADTSAFVAGHYTISWNGVDIGTTEQGITVSPVNYREDITVDDLGQTLVDGIYRGYNLKLSTELSAWSFITDANRNAWMFPFDASGAIGTIQGVGQTMVGSFAKQVVLTPTANINSHNKTYTYPLCIPEGNHGSYILATRLRKPRFEVIVLADWRASGNYGKLFAES